MRMLHKLIVLVNVFLYMLGCVTVGSFIGIMLVLGLVHFTGAVLSTAMIFTAFYITSN